MPDSDPIMIAARRVLMDALVALSEHREAIVLIGAQAVYHHTGSINLPIAPYTSDADVALNPQILGHEPEIAAALLAAHFVPGPNANPGEWSTSESVGTLKIEIPIDILVPESMVPGRRSARLQGHDPSSARRAAGIEAAIVDNSWTDLRALDPCDDRILRCRVAGPSALLVAKAHKISDRLEPGISPLRQNDKDALDVYRIALAVPMSEMEPVFRALLNDPRSAITTANGIELLVKLFGARRSPGTVMAVRSLEQTVPASRTEDVLTHLASELASVLS